MDESHENGAGMKDAQQQIIDELSEQLTAHTAALDQSKTALLAITSGPFYQSSCRGGEMERLMNQAIEFLQCSTP